MNANATHLDLEDLVAEVTGQTIDGKARKHLAGCGQCQLEAERWSLVADGIRGLAAEATEGPQPARPPRTRRPALAGPWRRAMVIVGSAAAVLVLLVVIGTAAGLVQVRFSGSGSETTLTSVSGCTRLEQADGTLKQVNGASVVIKTASGQLVTVTTTAATRLAASGALLADITNGATVLVAGTSARGTIAGDYVVVGANPPSLAVPGTVTVQGTVSDVGTAGFIVVTSAGTRVPVTTSGATVVTVSHASLGELQDGARTLAVGYAGPDRTLSALAVIQPPNWPAGAHTRVSVSNCSSGAINHEIMALAGGG